MSTLTRHLPTGFTVVAEPHSHHVSFTIYEIVGWSEGTVPGVFDVPEWENALDLADAEVYLHGDVKWDGCSNWHFDEQDRCMLHGCSRGDLQNLGEVMAQCWDWAAELLPQLGRQLP